MIASPISRVPTALGSLRFSFGRDTKKSDIDICLILNKKINKLEKRLDYSIINKKLDVQIFQNLPLYIRKRILKEGKILYCKDMDKLYDIALKTIREFEDYKFYYNYYIESMING